MENVFFTSDCHFYHKNIIKYCNRPFSSIEEMNSILINNWNSQVNNNDLVFCLGDLLWGTDINRLNNLIKQLNGNIILIKGNHDFYTDEQYLNANIKKVTSLLDVTLNDYKFVLCHYQLMYWNKSHYGTFHLYGHQHDKQQYLPNHEIYEKLGISERKMNVCMDSNEYKLFSLNEVIEKLKDRPINWLKK